MTADDLQEWIKTDEARERAEQWAEDFATRHPEPVEHAVPFYDFSSYQPAPEISQLQAAGGAGDLASVKKILESWEGSKGCFGNPLKPALEGGHLAHESYPFLDLYLRHGYRINDIESVWQPSPLADAYDDEEMLRCFLDHGADSNVERIVDGAKMGYTPLSKAMWRAPLTTIKLLFHYGGPDSINYGSLVWYCVSRKLSDRLQVLTYLLEKGAASDLNKLMFHDCPEPARQADWVVGRGTPLHAAAEDGDLAAAKLFVAWGADPATRDSRGRLAILVAREQLDLNKTNGDYQGVIDYLSALSNASNPAYEVGLTGWERL
ncbi:MAG: hypothetical protein Q9186_005564 [Xanthomendoza sp. 1 TL-2023]